MKISHIVFKELRQRKIKLLASFIAVFLGIAIIVSVETIGISAKKKITREIHDLGANILIIPEETKVSDYYTADFGKEIIPERYVQILHTSELSENVHEMIPKLSEKIYLKGNMFILTGILPKDEFRKKPSWRMTGPFLFDKEKKTNNKPENKTIKTIIKESEESIATEIKYEKKVKRKVFESLGLREIILGSETADILGLKEGQEYILKDRHFRISQVLDETGTIDDIRIFAHLHVVQDITGKRKVINAIEVVGCGCMKDLVKLSQDIEKLLPGVKVITIKDIAQTQSDTIKMMKRFSFILFIIVLIIGGAGIANYMSSEVYERRKEIGILLAIGATPGMISSLFLQKAILTGLVGGVIGYFAGTGLSILLGPKIIQISVLPQPIFILWSIIFALFFNIIFTFFPAKKAANLDPAVILQEE